MTAMISDSGAADGGAVTLKIGDSCSGNGQLSCAGHASKQRLICNDAHWRDNGTCDDSQFCETLSGLATGLCLPAVPECRGASPGDQVCEGNDLRTCDQDLLASKFVETCAFPTPNCDHGQCKCLDLCGGTVCLDLTTDPNNCGWCGRNCQGGACAQGLCQAVVLASGQSFTSGADSGDPGIVVDKTNVYWTTDTSVMSVPIAGGPAKTLAAVTALPAGIAVDASNVYWGERTLGPPRSGTINKVALTGGATVRLATDPSYWPSRLVVDANAVYFTNLSQASTIVKVPIAGGAAIALATNRKSPYAIASDAACVYWADVDDQNRGLLMAVPLPGGTPIVLASGLEPTETLVLDSGNLFWSSNSGLFTMPVAGANPVQLTVANSGTGGNLNVDERFVYMIAREIQKVPRAGGQGTRVAAFEAGGQPFEVTGDATNLYWLAGGEVKRWPK